MPGQDKLVENYRMNNSQCSHRVRSHLFWPSKKRDLSENWEHPIETPKESHVSSRIKPALE